MSWATCMSALWLQPITWTVYANDGITAICADGLAVPVLPLVPLLSSLYSDVSRSQNGFISSCAIFLDVKCVFFNTQLQINISFIWVSLLLSVCIFTHEYQLGIRKSNVMIWYHNITFPCPLLLLGFQLININGNQRFSKDVIEVLSFSAYYYVQLNESEQRATRVAHINMQKKIDSK